MFPLLKKGAPAVATVIALALTVSLVQVNTAAAGRGKATIEPESLGNAQQAKPRITPGYAGATVCCYLPRKNLLGILTPVQCKKAKGKVVPLKKCAQAGAKASDAYFVRVDRDTTTQNSARGDVTLKRGIVSK